MVVMDVVMDRVVNKEVSKVVRELNEGLELDDVVMVEEVITKLAVVMEMVLDMVRTSIF